VEGSPAPSMSDALQAEIQRCLIIQAAEKSFSAGVRDRLRAAALEALDAGRDPRSQERAFTGEVEELAYQDYLIQAYLERKVYKPVQITPAEVREYYQENKSQFSVPETITIRQILIRESSRSAEDAHAIAEKAYDRIKAGEDFAAVAAELSEGPYAEEGGLWPPQSPGDLIPDVEAQAIALEPGGTSQPFHTPLGWHIVRLESHAQAAVMPFEDVQGRIAQVLLEYKRNQARADLVAGLARKAVIKIGDGQE
jgi:peptidyl-prolyl cis-trans isomerase C